MIHIIVMAVRKFNLQLKSANFVSSANSLGFHIHTDGSHRRPGFAAKVRVVVVVMVVVEVVLMVLAVLDVMIVDFFG